METEHQARSDNEDLGITRRDEAWFGTLQTLTNQNSFKISDVTRPVLDGPNLREAEFTQSTRHTLRRTLRSMELYGYLSRDTQSSSIWKRGTLEFQHKLYSTHIDSLTLRDEAWDAILHTICTDQHIPSVNSLKRRVIFRGESKRETFSEEEIHTLRRVVRAAEAYRLLVRNKPTSAKRRPGPAASMLTAVFGCAGDPPHR